MLFTIDVPDCNEISDCVQWVAELLVVTVILTQDQKILMIKFKYVCRCCVLVC
jgi:hypothetical protein